MKILNVPNPNQKVSIVWKTYYSSVRDSNDIEAERQLMLDSYRELKQELLKEGLLKE